MIIGHSYGGSTVAHLLTTHYNDDLKYMIIDAPLFDHEASLIYKILSLPIIGKAIAFLANYTIAEGMIADGVASSVSNQSEAELASIIASRKNIWLQPKILYSKAKESNNYQEDLNGISPAYSKITGKVLIVSGQDSTKTFCNDAVKFSKLVASDSLILLDKTAHYIQIDQNDKIIKLIKQSLN